jgi:hypothetical protein
MKTSFLSKSLLLLTSIVMLGFVTSCDKTETEPKYQVGEYVKHVEELTAFVRFNEELGEWYLYYHIPGSIDSVHDFYPGELDKAYQQEDMKVVFSGDIYNIDYKNTIPTTESFRIVLSSIREWTEEDDKLGYWAKDEFIEFQIADPNVFLVQPRLNENPVSSERLKEILTSIGVENIISEWYKDRYIVRTSERPLHQTLYVSDQYKTSTADWIYVLPQICLSLETEDSLDAILRKYGEHLIEQEDSPNHGLHRFNCDVITSAEVLRLAAKIHIEPTVKWCEANKIVPTILD